jgi:hypothetical protein
MCAILALSDIQRHLLPMVCNFPILSINTMNPCPFSASLALQWILPDNSGAPCHCAGQIKISEYPSPVSDLLPLRAQNLSWEVTWAPHSRPRLAFLRRHPLASPSSR